MLKLNNIDARYGSARVLKDVSMEINDQEIVALVGSNGAGKSTLVKVILGIVKPVSGEIFFKGEDITNVPAFKRTELGIGTVPEGRRLFPKMSVEENLMVGGISPRVKKNRPKNIEEVYEIFPRLKERRHQVARTLSGGEQQMLAIGRALMSEPELIIFDEPSLGLAPIIFLDVFKTIKQINEERNMTVFVIEQNVSLSLTSSQRAYVIENGNIVLSGKSAELLDNPHVKKAYLGM